MKKQVKTMKNLKWVLLISILSVAYSCQTKHTNANLDKDTIKPIKVIVQKAEASVSSNQLTYNGNVIAKTTTPLSFLLPGTVVTVKSDEGDWVKKGQILAELNKNSYKSAYQGALATLKQAQDAYNRLKTVHDKGSLPEIKWQDVTTKLMQAKSANQIALQNLSNCTLKSPADGYIGMRNIEVGETSVPGVPVFKLVNINEVYVSVSVPENEINKMKKGQTASVSIPALGSQLFTGKIKKIGVVANPLSKTYNIDINIKNPHKIIKPGMACNISINTISTNNHIAIPYSCVSKDANGKSFVFIVDPQSKIAFKKSVKLGAFINNKIEILSGISVGELVVTEGKQKLSNKVKVIF